MEDLYHYYEQSVGAFINLSELGVERAQTVLSGLKHVFAAKRSEGYLARRAELEALVRELFIAKGGRPVRRTPYYMTVGACPWLETWYHTPAHIRIPLSEFDPDAVSFTYGDTFPTFSAKAQDGMEYRGQVYTVDEIGAIIDKYGLPQDKWRDPVFAQPAYVEAQIWTDEPIGTYKGAM